MASQYTYTAKKLPKQTQELTVTIGKTTITSEYENSFKKMGEELTAPGFRKGKAPKEVAEKYIKKESVFQNLLQALISKIYEEIVKKESIKPISYPKIELVSAKENEDWKVKITVAEKPSIDLSGYKELIQKSIKKTEIWVPGKDKVEKETPEAKSQKKLNQILSVLLEKVKIEISDIVIDEEVNKRLTQLVDDVQKIGLTVDSYLRSKNLTIDQLKSNYRKEIEDAYKLEFLLFEIADQEHIHVEKEELDKLLVNIKDEKERSMAVQNSYFYASLLRKQKTLDFLLSL